MRIKTLASVAVLGLSTAALAQVTRAPTQQAPANTVVADEASSAANQTDVAPANMMDTPLGNGPDAVPPPGEPSPAPSAPPAG